MSHTRLGCSKACWEAVVLLRDLWAEKEHAKGISKESAVGLARWPLEEAGTPGEFPRFAYWRRNIRIFKYMRLMCLLIGEWPSVLFS